MNNIQGRVKHDVLDELFRMGSVVHPDTLMTEVTSAMEKWNALTRMYNPLFKESRLPKFLQKKEHKRKPYRIYNKPQDFIRDLKSDKISEFPVDDKIYLIDLWNKIQDIRCVIELKCVAKNSQSNNVFADRNTLLAAQRVLDNKEEYLKL